MKFKKIKKFKAFLNKFHLNLSLKSKEKLLRSYLILQSTLKIISKLKDKINNLNKN